MTQEHPITLPPELVKQWLSTYFGTTITGEVSDVELTIATQAARWGADQELEACLQWFSPFYCMETWMQKDLENFRAARRPKPPSLKEQALDAWIRLRNEASCEKVDGDLDCLLRALESLPD